ncbi:MAG TPA: hypothetical protein VGS28_03155 [Candidatus Saccharimonadales bacterium]|nr:hypothetical protein [Candidatus Saccharimonadales bacterium]
MSPDSDPLQPRFLAPQFETGLADVEHDGGRDSALPGRVSIDDARALLAGYLVHDPAASAEVQPPQAFLGLETPLDAVVDRALEIIAETPNIGLQELAYQIFGESRSSLPYSYLGELRIALLGRPGVHRSRERNPRDERGRGRELYSVTAATSEEITETEVMVAEAIRILRSDDSRQPISATGLYRRIFGAGPVDPVIFNSFTSALKGHPNVTALRIGSGRRNQGWRYRYSGGESL